MLGRFTNCRSGLTIPFLGTSWYDRSWKCCRIQSPTLHRDSEADPLTCHNTMRDYHPKPDPFRRQSFQSNTLSDGRRSVRYRPHFTLHSFPLFINRQYNVSVLYHLTLWPACHPQPQCLSMTHIPVMATASCSVLKRQE